MIGALLKPGICLRLSTLRAFYVQSMQTLWCSVSVTPFLDCNHPSPPTYSTCVEQRPAELSSYSLGRCMRGAGILTCCPSATLLSLTLGPTNPTLIDIAWETLGIRRAGFSPALWLLMPTVSLLSAPPVPYRPASLLKRTLLYCALRTHPQSTRCVGKQFNPVNFRRIIAIDQ